MTRYEKKKYLSQVDIVIAVIKLKTNIPHNPFYNKFKFYQWKSGEGKQLKKTFAEAEIFRKCKFETKLKIGKVDARNKTQYWIDEMGSCLTPHEMRVLARSKIQGRN